MNGLVKWLGASAVALGLTAGVGIAATLDINADGQLIGAMGIDGGGDLYDVAFVDGDCDTVFDGCVPGTELTFNTADEATMASQALLDEVFFGGTFSASPDLTFGIDDGITEAFIQTPYDIDTVTVDFTSTVNHQATVLDRVRPPFSLFFPADTSTAADSVWAIWSLASDTPDVTPVPLPAGLPLMLAGLSCFGLVRRKRQSA